ncbi:Na+/H+ antiporter subunit E [Roseinatronobacter sp.]
MDRIFLKAVMHRAALFAGSWLVLTSAQPAAIAPGLVVSAAATWLSLWLLPARHPFAVWRLLRHVPRFLAGSVKGGVDVALRAFSPRMKLAPGWIEVPSALPDGARAALGGELSLMPGTLCAGSAQGNLLVHLLDTTAGFDHAIRREEGEIAAMIGPRPKGRT